MGEIAKLKNTEYDIVDLNEEIKNSSLTEAMNYELARINDTFKSSVIKKLPVAEVASLGAAFAALMPQGTAVAGALAQNGALFKCVFPTGVTGQLAQSGGQFLGGIMVDGGGLAQARWIPVAEGANGGVGALAVANPEIVLIAVAIVGIGMKINEIKKGQEKIIEILERDKKSQLIADYEILQDYLEDYRYYFENNNTVTVNLNQVKNIKRNALKDVKSYQEELYALLEDKNPLLKAISANGVTKGIFERFVHYKLAINVFAMASYMDIMLAKNYQAEYLEKEANVLKGTATSYDYVYGKCYEKLLDLNKSSFGSRAVKGLAWMSKGAGKIRGSIPVVEKGPVDEALLAGSEKLSEFDEKALAEMLDFFEEYKSCSALSVSEQIDTLNKISNEKTEMICDRENIYVFSERIA